MDMDAVFTVLVGGVGMSAGLVKTALPGYVGIIGAYRNTGWCKNYRQKEAGQIEANGICRLCMSV